MAVTKGQGAETVANAARAGFTLFGENRVQEGLRQNRGASRRFPGPDWRLIGPLQSNKAKSALQWFAAVESLDRERLAARLEALLAESATGRALPVLLEINVGRRGVQVRRRPRRRRRASTRRRSAARTWRSAA